MNQNSRYQQLADEIAGKIMERVATIEKPIRRAADVGKAHIAVTTGRFTLPIDPKSKKEEITLQLAATMLDQTIDLYANGIANRSQTYIVESLIEDRRRVHDILDAAMKDANVDKFWRHHTKTHKKDAATPEEENRPILGEAGKGLLGEIIRRHYAEIPVVADITGPGR
jgi:hypothetical protein